MPNSAPAVMPPRRLPLSARVAAVLLVLAPFVGSVLWSHTKYLWIDELLQYYSDSRPSGWAVLLGQMHHPFSLEPPLYHLVLHYCLWIFPSEPAFIMRMPAMLLFALLQVCLFRVLIRLTQNWGAALVAMALPLALSTYLFSPEARVYELMACMFAVAFLAYCTALQSEGQQRQRAWIVLGAPLGVAVLSHYYGIFEPVPFVLAELVRAIRNRKVEPAPWLALLAALASFALNVPFLAGLHTVRVRYYDAGLASWDRIPFTYTWLFGQNDVYMPDPHSELVRRVSMCCLYGLLPAALVSLAWRRRRDLRAFQSSQDRDAVLLSAFFALFVPVMTVMVSHFVTHAYWPRYSVEAVLPIVIVLAVAATPTLRGWYGTVYLLFIILAVAAHVTSVHYDLDTRSRLGMDAEMANVADLVKAEKQVSDPHIYLQQVGRLLVLNTFAPPDQRTRLVDFDSPERAAFYDKHTPITAFAQNIAASTSLTVIPYEQLRQMPGPHILLIFKEPAEEWIGSELERPGATKSVVPAGRALNGFLYIVTFPPAGT